MSWQRELKHRVTLSRVEWMALAFACLLSLGCLLRGAVYDTVIAALLLAYLPLLYLVFIHDRPVHIPLKKLGLMLLMGLAFVLFLQQAVGDSTGLWDAVKTLAATDAGHPALSDKSGWSRGLLRILFYVDVFLVALVVGSSESASRLFFQALLVTGTLCIALTFFMVRPDAYEAAPTHYFSHGFVNANNASSYLGIMLLLVLAQAARMFKLPGLTTKRLVLDFFDQLSIAMILRDGFIFFALLLVSAGLFMTGSRAGIFLALLCVMVFISIMAFKANLRHGARALIIIGATLSMVVLFVWAFAHYGQAISSKFAHDGLSSNSRVDLILATLPMIADRPLLGSGLGSFASAFQPYRPQNVTADGIFDKAHNSYVEFAAEMGIPMFLLLMGVLASVGWMLYLGINHRQERYVTPTLGLAVWLFAALHSLIDFPLQIPGILALWIAILVIAVSQTDRRFSEPSANNHAPTKRVRIRKRHSAIKI